MKSIDLNDLVRFRWFHNFLRVEKLFAYLVSAHTDVISRIFGQKGDRRNIEISIYFLPHRFMGDAHCYLIDMFFRFFRLCPIFDFVWSIQIKQIPPCVSSHQDLSIHIVTIPNGRYKLYCWTFFCFFENMFFVIDVCFVFFAVIVQK